ncbi:hypothetical protein THAOC_22275, partial [Thalassiosira oceanica]
SGKTTWEPTSSLTSTATPCFGAEILKVKQPGTPQIQQVYDAMDSLLAYGASFSNRAARRAKWTLSRPKLVPSQDDIEEIHLRRREADGPIPWIPALRAMIFGSFRRRCIGEKKIGKVGWLIRPTHIMK